MPASLVYVKVRQLMFSVFLLVVFCISGKAQCVETQRCTPQIPHVIKFSGRLKNLAGEPRRDIVGLTFAIYPNSSGGAALWQENQNVQLDQQGRYAVLLGSSTLGGVPIDLFSSGEPRWLGVQVQGTGELEEARILMVSVPYAFEAANAETLGGLPASSFVRAEADTPVQNAIVTSSNSSNLSSAHSVQVAVTGGSASTPNEQPVTTAGGTAGIIASFSGGTSITNSQITDSGGMVTLQNLSNILFADRYSGGVPQAVAACPTSGCMIYALSPKANINLGTIDPGTKSITLFLGPYTYTVNHIMLRSGLKIIGAGSSPNGTILQSVNGNDPVFTLPQANYGMAHGVLLSNFRLIGSSGNTREDAFLLDTSSLFASGLWYSTLSDIYISNFAGSGIHIKGPPNFGAVTQWVTFNTVTVYRPQGGSNGIRIEGGAYELYFHNCEVEGYAPNGQAQPDSGANVYLGGVPGDAGGENGYPLDISFQGLVSQGAATAVQLDGAVGISFHHSHHEILLGGYLITGNTGVGTWGVTISDSTFMGNVGLNGGAGYLLKIDTTFVKGIRFTHNIFSSPDAVVAGINLSDIVYQDNLYLGQAPVPPTSGITLQLTPAASINIAGAHSVGLSSSATAITTIQSTLGPGEMVTFFSLGGNSTFGAGGNINLIGRNSISVNGSVTFIRTDGTGTLQWVPVSQWPPTSFVGVPSAGLTILPAASSATVDAGASATFDLTLSPTGNFSGIVQLTCAGEPIASRCIFSPDPVRVAIGRSSPVALTVQTSSQVASTREGGRHSKGALTQLYGLGGLAACCLLSGVPVRVRKRFKRIAATSALALLLVTCSACGNTLLTTFSMTNTAPGIYRLTVTASSGSLMQSTVLTLIVN